jgi:uncharacterized membrane protein (DUF2068 family)
VTFTDPATSTDTRHARDAIGLRLIIGLKLAKALIELPLGISLLIFASAGLRELTMIAEQIRHHTTEAWSIVLAERLIHVSTARNLVVVAVASIADALMAMFEGWALHRRYLWSRWLVVGTTSSFIPLEGFALVRHPSAVRAVLLLLNALIVVYLLIRKSAFVRVSS